MTTLGLATVLLVAFIGQVDMFIVNVAAPGIQRDLGATFEELQFVVNGYVIVYAAGMVLGGRAGDRFGHRRVFNLGVVAFAVTSALCAVAPNAPLLIVARALQGAAAAAMMPQVLSMLHANYPAGPERSRAVGAYGASIGLGVIAGLIGGGLLMAGDIAGLGWRSVFLINVPICVVALVGSWVSVPESRGARAQRLDLVGALLAAVLLPAVLVPLAVGGSLGWPVWTWACLTASVIVLVGLVRHQRALERRDLDPIIPPRLFARPGFSLCMLLVVLFFAGNAGLFLVLTYHLQAGLELGPLATGLVFTPLGAGFVLGSTVSKGLVARFGSRVSVAGALLMTASLVVVPLVTGVEHGLQAWLLAAVLGVSGIGQGLVVAPLVDTVLSLVPSDESGAGSGVFNTLTQAGMASGVAVIGAVYQGVLGTNPEAPDVPLTFEQFRSAFDGASWVLAILAVVTAVLVARVGRIADRVRAAAPATASGASTR
ncbi:MFS transporter [Pseudonocardia sp. UM4_GMWB1]